MSYLFDTTVAIDWARGHPGAKAVVEACFAETGLLYTCDVVTCEALSGGADDERDVIRRFLIALEYVAIDTDGAAHAGELRRMAGRSAGHSLGDAIIAALASRSGATVVTRNPKDFAAYDVPVIAYGAPIA